MTTTDPTKPHICTADGGPACPGHTPNCEPGCAQPAAAADSTGRPPRADAGASLVSGEYNEAAAHHDALLRQVEQARAENARLRSQLAEAREALVRVAKTLGWDAPPEQVPSGVPDLAIAVQELRRQRDQARTVLAEARQQRDQAAEALVRAETERDEARAEIARLERAAHEQGADLWIAEDRLDRLRRQVLAVAEDLERYASDPEGLPMSERKLAWTLRQIVAGERPEAPETGPTAPQTDEQAGVRGDSRTEASAGADGPWSDAWCRTQLQRLSIAASEQYGLRWRDYDVVGAVIAEIDRLRTALGSQGGSR